MAAAPDAGGSGVAPAAPAYAGVEPRGDKFVAWARVAGRRVLLPGVFDAALDAARASDRAHVLAGAAPLNFGAERYASEPPLAAGLSPEALTRAVKEAVAAPRLRGRLSRFRGVGVTKERNWKPEVRVGDAAVPLGVFADEAEAAKAYDRACVMLRREPANFPRADYSDVQPLPVGADAAAALRAAFQPRARSSAFVGTSARKAGALGRGKAPAGPRWEAYIKVGGKKLSLGLHGSEEAAARCYDRAHLLLRGTAVNFAAEQYAAENLPRLTLGPAALSGDALRAALKARAGAAAGAAADEDDGGDGSDEAGEGGDALPRKRARLPAAPKLCGVSLRKAAGGGESGPAERRWEAYAKVGGRKIALGVHASEEAAARAHDAAMLVLRGAARNFPAASYAADVASGRLARRADVTAEELRAIAAPRGESHPTLLGVTRTRLGGTGDEERWRAQLTVDGAALRWGTGADAAAAGFAYDVARMCIRGCPANAAPHDPRLAAVPRAAAELRGDALRAFVIAAVHDAFHRLGLSHAIVEAPAAPGAPAGGDHDDMGPEQLLLDSDDRDREDF